MVYQVATAVRGGYVKCYGLFCSAVVSCEIRPQDGLPTDSRVAILRLGHSLLSAKTQLLIRVQAQAPTAARLFPSSPTVWRPACLNKRPPTLKGSIRNVKGTTCLSAVADCGACISHKDTTNTAAQPPTAFPTFSRESSRNVMAFRCPSYVPL